MNSINIILIVIILFLIYTMYNTDKYTKKEINVYQTRPYWDLEPYYYWFYSWFPIRSSYYSTYRPRRHHRKQHSTKTQIKQNIQIQTKQIKPRTSPSYKHKNNSIKRTRIQKRR